MAKQRAATAGTFVQELFQMGLYKRSQGRITRQITCGTVWLIAALSAWKLWGQLEIVDWSSWSGRLGNWVSSLNQAGLEYWIPGGLLLVGIWLGVRLVNIPRFADFLIAVEAEMNKVSWPSRGELIRSSMVVIFVIFALAFVLFGYDVLWKFLFELIGVRQG